jgi:hypothetical protein
MTARLTTFWPVWRVVPLGSRSHQSRAALAPGKATAAIPPMTATDMNELTTVAIFALADRRVDRHVLRAECRHHQVKSYPVNPDN